MGAPLDQPGSRLARARQAPTAWLPGEGKAAAPGGYHRRRPEHTVLWQTLREHWLGFRASVEDAQGGTPLPSFVVKDVEAYLRCGILAHGFVRTRCRDCGDGRVVAFSCKRRGFCPSCIGRRMCDTAVHLVDHVIPDVPVRQWVLTAPYALRLRMAYDPALASRVLGIVVAAVSSWLKRRARRMGIKGRLETGGVTVIQRFNSALDLNLHFHSEMLDGVYRMASGARPEFIPTPAPDDEDVAAVVARIRRRVKRMLRAIGGDAKAEQLALDEPALLAMANASVQGLVATGPRRGRRPVRIQGAEPVEAQVLGRRCAQVGGFNLHANVRVAANNRAGLERLCRYLARPPVANDRLSKLQDGRLLFRLKRAWSDGTTAVIMEPHELIERLVALVPRPRKHLTRYHGVLAPAFRRRAEIVPGPPAVASGPTAAAPAPPGSPRLPTRHPWAWLLKRVFLVDVLRCDKCGGKAEVVAAVTEAGAVERMLRGLGLPSEVPRFHPPRPPPAEGVSSEHEDFDAVDPPAPDDPA